MRGRCSHQADAPAVLPRTLEGSVADGPGRDPEHRVHGPVDHLHHRGLRVFSRVATWSMPQAEDSWRIADLLRDNVGSGVVFCATHGGLRFICATHEGFCWSFARLIATHSRAKRLSKTLHVFCSAVPRRPSVAILAATPPAPHSRRRKKKHEDPNPERSNGGLLAMRIPARR